MGQWSRALIALAGPGFHSGHPCLTAHDKQEPPAPSNLTLLDPSLCACTHSQTLTDTLTHTQHTLSHTHIHILTHTLTHTHTLSHTYTHAYTQLQVKNKITWLLRHEWVNNKLFSKRK